MAKIVAALLIMLVVFIIAGLSASVQEPLFAPSLASAAFTQLLTPTQPSAKPYATLVGQLVGLLAGLVGVFASSAASAPEFMGGHPLVFQRVLAVAIAALLTALGQLSLKAGSPAGGATAVIMATGAETADLAGTARLVVGIALVTGLGEIARQLLLRGRLVP